MFVTIRHDTSLETLSQKSLRENSLTIVSTSNSFAMSAITDTLDSSIFVKFLQIQFLLIHVLSKCAEYIDVSQKKLHC